MNPTQLADLEKELISDGVSVLVSAKAALVQAAAAHQSELNQELAQVEDHIASVALSFIPRNYQAEVQAFLVPVEAAAKPAINGTLQRIVASGVARIEAAINGAHKAH